jgi:hypothetical protein
MRRRRSGAGAASAVSSGGTSAFISLHMGFDPGREVQEKYGKCTKINDPANSVWREKCAVFHANTMRVEDAKKAAKLQGGIDHAAVG